MQLNRYTSWICQPRAVFAVALVVLSVVCLTVTIRSPEFRPPPKAVGDGLEYENIGFHLWKSGEFRINNKDDDWLSLYAPEAEKYRAHLDAKRRDMLTTGRPPLFPAIIAAVYATVGRNETGFAAIRILSAMFIAIAGALATFSLAKILQRLSPDYVVASEEPKSSPMRSAATRHTLASLLAIVSCVGALATNRTLLSYTEDFLTEPLSLLLLQAFVVLLLVEALEDTKMKRGSRQNLRVLAWVVLVGLVFASLILARSVFVVWLPAVTVIVFLIGHGGIATRSLSALVFVLIVCLACSGWWLRNMSVLERAMPLGTQGPITLLGTYSDAGWKNRGEWTAEPETQLRASLGNIQEWAISDRQFEVLVAEKASRMVKSWISENPGKLLRMTWPRIKTHWNPYFGKSLVWKVLILLGAVAVLFRLKHLKRVAPILIGIPLVSTIVVAMLYSVGGRFLVPVYGLLSVLSGLGVYGMISVVVGLASRGDRERTTTE